MAHISHPHGTRRKLIIHESERIYPGTFSIFAQAFFLSSDWVTGVKTRGAGASFPGRSGCKHAENQFPGDLINSIEVRARGLVRYETAQLEDVNSPNLELIAIVRDIYDIFYPAGSFLPMNLRNSLGTFNVRAKLVRILNYFL